MNAAIKLLTTLALNTLLAAKYIVLMANIGKILQGVLQTKSVGNGND